MIAQNVEKANHDTILTCQLTTGLGRPGCVNSPENEKEDRRIERPDQVEPVAPGGGHQLEVENRTRKHRRNLRILEKHCSLVESSKASDERPRYTGELIWCK